jgi:hypothetical protein
VNVGESARKGPCAARTKQGPPCRSFAPPGRRYCFGHDPERRDEVRAARGKGGKLKAIRGRRARLDSPAALATFTANLIHDVVAGDMTPEVARTAVYALSLQRTLLETSTMEHRLAALERQLAVNAQRRAAWPA